MHRVLLRPAQVPWTAVGARQQRRWSRSPLLASGRGQCVFRPHTALPLSSFPSRESWADALNKAAEASTGMVWEIDLVSLHEAARIESCRSPSNGETVKGRASATTALLRDAASVLGSHIEHVDNLSLHVSVDDGAALLVMARLLGRALTTGALTQLSITLLPPPAASPASREAAQRGNFGAFLDAMARLPRLRSLSSFTLIVMEAAWDDAVTASLAHVLAVLHLRVLVLNYVPVRNGPYAALSALARAIGASRGTLETLDLKGMGPLLRHTTFLRASDPHTHAADDLHLGHFTRLRHLDVGYTQLGDVAFASLLAALRMAVGGWARLLSLGLAQCDVSAYGIELLHRDVSAVGVQAAEASPASVAAIELLNLSSNLLPDAVAFELASCLVVCRRLQGLDLRHNRFTQKSVGTILSALVHASDLRTLCLRANRIQDEGFSQVAHLFRYWSELTELDLTRCHLTSASLWGLSAALPQLASLSVLRLAGNDLRDVDASLPSRGHDGMTTDSADMKLFAYDPAYMRGGRDEGGEALKVPTSYELDRRDREEGRERYRGPVFDADGDSTTPPAEGVFAVFGEALNSCRALQTLDLSDSCLSDEGFVRFTSAGVALPGLVTLNLSANHLFHRVDALDRLVAWLWCAPQVATLDLSFTGLGDLGLSMLCDGPATSEDAASVVGVLTALPCLRHLHLAHCVVTEGLGVEALAGCLSRLPALEVLVLNGNVLSDGAVTPWVALLEAAQRCPRLRHISLHGCATTSEAQSTLKVSDAYGALVAAGMEVLL